MTFKVSSVKILTIISLAWALAGCGPAALSFREASSNSLNGGNNGTNNIGNPNICPPGSSGNVTPGIEGNLYYLPAGSQPLNSVVDYLQPSYEASQTYYWDQIFVPTELYTQGFPQANGNPLTDSSGNVLTLNFALDLKTVISLSATDSPGDYEFGILSDDGSVLKIANSNGNMQTVVNNDGVHPTRLGCATMAVPMTATTQLNAELQYYQGPATQIALVLLWKKVSGSLDTTYCGDEGNGTFFNYNNVPSTPEPEYNNMLARGWAPLKPANYTLPAGASNPCL